MNKQHLLNYWTKTGIVKNQELIKAFKKIKREDFVLNKEEAYLDIALPILEKQTISQPSTIMIMLEALELKKGDKVLEIGTGSGYNASLIAEVVKPANVYTTEIIPELVEFAKNNLKKANITNVKVFNTDGSKGLLKYSPYDKCIVTAACPEIPKPLISQLKNNGILIAPVGSYSQIMVKITKKNNELIKENLGNFVFVPLKGKYGF
ncbi:MAG: protein-L-isoaspartate(D-aspartate) O-methyltransferase [Nanoarchaeota archaeon]|nr:protein-L-isoaspartate(D-aspartate) O-methyltransferase [Nanoarchaeota archaeon]